MPHTCKRTFLLKKLHWKLAEVPVMAENRIFWLDGLVTATVRLTGIPMKLKSDHDRIVNTISEGASSSRNEPFFEVEHLRIEDDTATW